MLQSIFSSSNNSLDLRLTSSLAVGRDLRMIYRVKKTKQTSIVVLTPKIGHCISTVQKLVIIN